MPFIISFRFPFSEANAGKRAALVLVSQQTTHAHHCNAGTWKIIFLTDETFLRGIVRFPSLAFNYFVISYLLRLRTRKFLCL
jgi:hypothetical protein